MKIKLSVAVLVFLFSLSVIGRTLIAIPEPIREIISFEQLKNLGFVPEMGPEQSPKEERWLRFEIPKSIHDRELSFAEITLMQGDIRITNFTMSPVGLDNKKYVTCALNSNIVSHIIIEFWFDTRHVYEVLVNLNDLSHG